MFRSIHVAANSIISFFFIPVCECVFVCVCVCVCVCVLHLIFKEELVLLVLLS